MARPQDELVAGSPGLPEPIHPQTLLAQVLDRANLRRALKQVRQNKGAPGIDGMTVDALPEYLRHHWQEIRAQLEAGRYQPQPVKRVDIPKADGKTRPLGILTTAIMAFPAMAAPWKSPSFGGSTAAGVRAMSGYPAPQNWY